MGFLQELFPAFSASDLVSMQLFYMLRRCTWITSSHMPKSYCAESCFSFSEKQSKLQIYMHDCVGGMPLHVNLHSLKILTIRSKHTHE